MNNAAHYRFFENTQCEYYPCHTNVDTINCLFCFCPLYRISECGGHYIMLASGIKDCSKCTLPHSSTGYDTIIRRLVEVNEGV